MDHVITLQELREELDGPNPPVIVDARQPARYAAGHIPGALNIPVRNIDLAGERIPRDRPVVTY